MFLAILNLFRFKHKRTFVLCVVLSHKFFIKLVFSVIYLHSEFVQNIPGTKLNPVVKSVL